jgi:hypothetical protein
MLGLLPGDVEAVAGETIQIPEAIHQEIDWLEALD